MKKSILLSLSIIGLLFLNSCNKGCDLPEDVSSGAILENAIVYPDAGYQTTIMYGDYHIDGGHTFADDMTVSFDEGQTRSSLNYGQYNILCYPTTVSCDASFDRNVTIDHANGFVTYTIKVNECSSGGCNQQRKVENYVVVPAFPSTYNVFYSVQ